MKEIKRKLKSHKIVESLNSYHKKKVLSKRKYIKKREVYTPDEQIGSH